MLGDKDVHAIVAVKDLETAKNFYENTLGLKKVSENPGGVMYASGNTKIFVYPSENAGTNQANAASWEVDNLDEVIDALKNKGVVFEQYDLPGVTREGDIHIMGPMKAAWFKDPSGNIMCIGNAM
jgi:catechol 2,3-dioxygenase-like lactoylglutathione lyase family enzyme